MLHRARPATQRSLGEPCAGACLLQRHAPPRTNVHRMQRAHAVPSGCSGDWQPRGQPVQPAAAPGTGTTLSHFMRQAAYSKTLSPILSILALAPRSRAAVGLLRAILQADSPAAAARGQAAELDDALPQTIHNCWAMVMSLARDAPLSQDPVHHQALVMLDEAWSAVTDAHTTDAEPELSLLRRLMHAWSPEHRAVLLQPPEAAHALTSHGGLFFALLDQEWQRCAEQHAWGDARLEGRKAARLAALSAIRAEARRRVEAGAEPAEL